MKIVIENELIYKIGEVIMLEIEEINDLKYDDKNKISLYTKDGKKYSLLLLEI